MRTIGGMTVCRVSREAGIADHGLVLTGKLDDDSLSYNAAAMDVARASGLALAELFSDWKSGRRRFSGDLSCADLDAVDS
jgi:N-methylhydantoinase B